MGNLRDNLPSVRIQKYPPSYLHGEAHLLQSDSSHELKVASHHHELFFAQQLESITEETTGFGKVNRVGSVVSHRVLTHEIEVGLVPIKRQGSKTWNGGF